MSMQATHFIQFFFATPLWLLLAVLWIVHSHRTTLS